MHPRHSTLVPQRHMSFHLKFSLIISNNVKLTFDQKRRNHFRVCQWHYNQLLLINAQILDKSNKRHLETTMKLLNETSTNTLLLWEIQLILRLG